MPHLLLKDLPRYECLLECAKRMPGLEPSACESYLHLLRAADEAFRVVDAHFNARGVTQGRFTVLMLLIDKGAWAPCAHSPATLAEMAGVSRATMTGLIDTLERDGLVIRNPDAVDRRQLLVSITAKGEELLLSMLPEHFHRIRLLLAPLSELERRSFVQLLSKIADHAADRFPKGSPSVEAA